MIIAVLGILDVIAGIILSLGGMPIFHGNGVVFIVGIAILAKGVYSWIAAMTKNFMLDFPGILDIVAGILILSTSGGFFLFFFAYIGVLEIIKGAYSFMMGCIR